MLKKIRNSFWWGFAFGLTISIITAYLTWPKIPLDYQLIEGTKIDLPRIGDPVGVVFPKDGDKLSKVFVIYGSGFGWENRGVVELTDKNDQVLKSVPVYFNSQRVGESGPFIVSMNLFDIDPVIETGKIKLYSLEKQTDKKQIGDFINVRLK